MHADGHALHRTGLFGLILLTTLAAHAATREPDIARGKTLATACAACHGTENLKVDPLYSVPRIGLQNARYLLNALKAYKGGKRTNAIMQAQVAGLGEQDLRDLAAYFGQQGDDTRAAAAVRALGEGSHAAGIPKSVIAVCGGCHGETGGGSMPEAPSLAGQYADYMVHALEQYRSGKRQSDFMGALARSLSSAEIHEISDYYASHTTQPFSVTSTAPPTAVRPGPAASTANPRSVRDGAGGKRSSAQVIRDLAMADLPAGRFMMGDPATEGFSVGSPQHEVQVKAFRIGKYEVSFDEYDAFASETRRALPDDEGWGRGNRPVINVTWADTQAFIGWLNRKTGRRFRLPSEAEWEYAARGATTTVYWWGDAFDPAYINARGTNERDAWPYTAPVGQFPANPFGLHDTSGNVAERVADCWHPTYEGAPVDGSAWIEKGCPSRIARGGSWNLAKRPMRSSARSGIADSIASMSIGFRLAEDRE